jgi:hypothetical protein
MADVIYAHCAVRATTPPVTRRWPRVPGGAAPRAVGVGHGLWVIVSTVPGTEYEERNLAARLADAEWLAQCGAAHHAVIARASRGYAVAPFRLLTLFRSDARVAEEATRLRSKIERALDRVGDRREWVVRVAAVARPSTSSRAQPATGTSYLLARAAESRSSSAAPAVRRATRAFVADVRRCADRIVQRHPDAAHVVYDGALLVSRTREQDLSLAVREWAPRLAPMGCRVSLTGPWPPYSFVSFDRPRSTQSHGRR